MSSQVHKTVLGNGVRILSKTMPHTRTVSAGVWVNVGARDESSEQSGSSHFIEHMLFKGTSQRSAYQIAKEFDAIGGQTNAFTSMENTCYHARVIDAHLETMVDILTDIFLNSLFEESELERERPVIFQEIGMMEDSPEDYIHILTGGTYWGDHPLGRSILGSRQTVGGFDASALKSFFRQFYQPDRIVIAAAGNVSHPQLVDLLGPAFESVCNGSCFPERVPPEGRSRVDLHPRSIEQLHICLSAPGLGLASPQKYAFSLMNTILGGNMSSRLFQEIRERRGLAYSVYSFMQAYTDTGMFCAYTGVDPQRASEAVEQILEQLQRLKEKPVSEATLRDAKEFTKGNLFMAAESVDNQMFRLAQNELTLQAYIPLQTVVEKIEAVTPVDIQALARSLFQKDRLALTLLGPIAPNSAFENLLSI